MPWRRIRYWASVALACGLAGLFSSCNGRGRASPEVPVVELAVLDAFPHSQESEESDLIWQGADIETGPDGRIYVADAKALQIHIFDAEGRHILSFGRGGQGPGEFTFPHAVAVSPNRIFIKDRGNLIKTFNLDGRFIGQIRPPLPISGFAVKDDRRLYACRIFPVDPELREKALGDPAILVLDEAGAVVDSFGRPVPLVKDMNVLNMTRIALDESGGIYAAYEYVPLVRKYSASGRLIKENGLPYDFIAEYRRENERTYGTSSYFSICPDIKSDGERIYVMCLDKAIVRFLEMGPDLDLRAVYRLNLATIGESVRSRCFAVGSKDGQRRFYLLEGGDLGNLAYVAGPR